MTIIIKVINWRNKYMNYVLLPLKFLGWLWQKIKKFTEKTKHERVVVLRKGLNFNNELGCYEEAESETKLCSNCLINKIVLILSNRNPFLVYQNKFRLKECICVVF